jgi:deoxyribonuclease V
MNEKTLHHWNISSEEAIYLQRKLREKLVLADDNNTESFSIVAGADISYSKGSSVTFAAVVLMRYPEMETIEESFNIQETCFPYIPGLLTFREGPALLGAFKGLKHSPDAIIFDGQGIAHPRGIGLASHMGLFLNIPAIGCAKTRLIGTHDSVGPQRGDLSCLRHNSQIIGAVLRTKSGVKPVFVSQGHRISLERSVNLVLSCCRGYRLPEPVRTAHLAVNQLRLKTNNPSTASQNKLRR